LLCLYCRVRLLTWVGCAVSTISTTCSTAQHSTAVSGHPLYPPAGKLAAAATVHTTQSTTNNW
jgi:hypothetical protein